jgi:DNA-binding MarR family transcriptional regulator
MQLRAAYLAMHRQTNVHLAGLGITADQFVCLLILRDEDGIIQRELVERASSDQNTMRAVLMLLEEKGYVRRERDERDARARVVRLTASGRKVTDRAVAAVRRIHDAMRSALSADEAAQLNRLLEHVSATLLALPPQA